MPVAALQDTPYSNIIYFIDPIISNKHTYNIIKSMSLEYKHKFLEFSLFNIFIVSILECHKMELKHLSRIDIAQLQYSHHFALIALNLQRHSAKNYVIVE